MLAAETSAVAAPALTAPSPKTVWKQISCPVEPFLEAVSQRMALQIQEFEPDIARYAEYALTVQGKQLRPVLVALSAGATGEEDDSHVLAALVVQMVRLATLGDDDAMDGAEIRRRRQSLG